MCEQRRCVPGPASLQSLSGTQSQDRAGVTSVQDRLGGGAPTAPRGQTFCSNQNLRQMQKEGSDVLRAVNEPHPRKPLHFLLTRDPSPR